MASKVGYDKCKGTTEEWYTPKEILDELGEFDLDPCAPVQPLWNIAKTMYNKHENGLAKEWFGRVWLNPPYSNPIVGMFVKKLAEHNNGIALLFNRFDTDLFHEMVFPNATAIKILRHRIRFYQPDGTRSGSPGCGSVLIAFGEENAKILEQSRLEGKFIRLK